MFLFNKYYGVFYGKKIYKCIFYGKIIFLNFFM